ncbi:hypothetical protein J6590_055354 [Homalodisca vitripennis]|nr:hypothetical protein J6590_055354 [Homalodisca vitripennis]
MTQAQLSEGKLNAFVAARVLPDGAEKNRAERGTTLPCLQVHSVVIQGTIVRVEWVCTSARQAGVSGFAPNWASVEASGLAQICHVTARVPRILHILALAP